MGEGGGILPINIYHTRAKMHLTSGETSWHNVTVNVSFQNCLFLTHAFRYYEAVSRRSTKFPILWCMLCGCVKRRCGRIAHIKYTFIYNILYFVNYVGMRSMYLYCIWNIITQKFTVSNVFEDFFFIFFISRNLW